MRIKTFESHSTLYSKMTVSEYNSLRTETIPVSKFDERELMKIFSEIGLVPAKRSTLRPNVIKAYYLKDRLINVTISKIDDGWFIVRQEDIRKWGKVTYWKCDQVDGIRQMIEDYEIKKQN
jgi:hypothetical protein